LKAKHLLVTAFTIILFLIINFVIPKTITLAQSSTKYHQEFALLSDELESKKSQIAPIDVHLSYTYANDPIDMIITSPGGTSICKGVGNGNFTCENINHIGSYGIALGDLNEDGVFDYLLARNDEFGGEEINFVCLGTVNNDFTCEPIDNVAYESTAVSLGDVNNDGNLDAVFANDGSSTPFSAPDRVCIGNGNGGFSCNLIGHAYLSEDVALGDLNNDGNLDAVFANTNTYSACLGDGLGGFTCLLGPSGWNSAVALGDLNEDGNLDAASFDITFGNIIPNEIGNPPATINFESIPGETPFEGLEINNQFGASHGIIFSLENEEDPVLAKVGAPATAFYGCGDGCPDTPALIPNRYIGSFFLTNDGMLSSLEAEALIVTYNPPTAVASGVILDIDFDETFTIEARDANENILETITITAGEPNTGDGIATPWVLQRSNADVHSLRFAGQRQDAGVFGLGFDNFNARSAMFYTYLPFVAINN
jgi:hypothetical protein